MSDILERLYRRAADMGKFNADQQVILQAADEIRRLRASLAALRTKDIAQLVVIERNRRTTWTQQRPGTTPSRASLLETTPNWSDTTLTGLTVYRQPRLKNNDSKRL